MEIRPVFVTEIHPMSDIPRISGRYIVMHRGMVGQCDWLDPEVQWKEGTKTGWYNLPSWKPTHWMETPPL